MRFPAEKFLRAGRGARRRFQACRRRPCCAEVCRHVSVAAVRLVGYGAGSAPDVGARVSSRIGCPAVSASRLSSSMTDPAPAPISRPEAVARATPDGYTLLADRHAEHDHRLAAPESQLQLPARHCSGGGSLGGTPFVVVANPDFPPKTIPELIAYAKANPGKVNFTSNGTGNLTHIAGELFKMMAGVDLFHVPVPWRSGGADRPHRRPRPDHVRSDHFGDRPRQGRQAARAGGDHGKRRLNIAGCRRR